MKQYKTNTPIANALVLITRGAPGSGIGSSIVDTLITDEFGRVEYNKNVDENYMYYAEAYKEGYFDTRNSQVSVTPGKKNFTTTIYMYAHSWVKLHVKNVNPYDQFDLIQLSSYCHPNLYFQGLNIDTTFLYCGHAYEWMGDFENYAYLALVTKNNQSFTIPYSFVPIPHDTITIIINY
ncbi:MAG: hypothetical protein H0U27_12225 [Nitrosopumilus sp.]|nr:hypothetical protein [Nitrosopumilus sp.]